MEKEPASVDELLLNLVASGEKAVHQLITEGRLSRSTVELAITRLMASGKIKVRYGRQPIPRRGRAFVNLYSLTQG